MAFRITCQINYLRLCLPERVPCFHLNVSQLQMKLLPLALFTRISMAVIVVK